MVKVKDNNIEVEVLIATMHRTTIDFISTMFPNNMYLDLNILIVNQTSSDKLLKSTLPNIRVFNSFERGLSKSRNLAIEKSQKSICLIADDDVVFQEGFIHNIVEAHEKYNDSIITFQTKTTSKKLYWDYPLEVRNHNNFISEKTLSIEITFKREDIIKSGLCFNEAFGLGSKFEDGENNIFLCEAKKKSLSLLFVPSVLSMHEAFSSSDAVESDRLLYAKAAVNTYKYGRLSYFWVLKFVFFLLRKKLISASEIIKKITLGVKGIHDFKKLNVK